MPVPQTLPSPMLGTVAAAAGGQDVSTSRLLEGWGLIVAVGAFDGRFSALHASGAAAPTPLSVRAASPPFNFAQARCFAL